MSTVVTNRYPFPRGYQQPPRGPIVGYKPFNNYWNGGPSNIIIGASQEFQVVTDNPADGSTLIINTPGGQSFTFEFVFTGSLPVIPGSFAVLLPAGGGTIAQTVTALSDVMSEAGGTPWDGGAFQSFPWHFLQDSASEFTLEYSQAGANQAPGGTAFDTGEGASINLEASVAALYGFGNAVPGIFGKNFCFLPGNF